MEEVDFITNPTLEVAIAVAEVAEQDVHRVEVQAHNRVAPVTVRDISPIFVMAKRLRFQL